LADIVFETGGLTGRQAELSGDAAGAFAVALAGAGIRIAGGGGRGGSGADGSFVKYIVFKAGGGSTGREPESSAVFEVANVVAVGSLR